MKTLRDLNSTSLSNIDFTDDRDPDIIFDRDYPDDQSVTEVEGQPIYIPKGTEIVEIINGEDLDLEIEFTYPDDLTDTQYPNKPSYITATAVNDPGTNQSITFSGFKSASDYTWLFENFYVKGSRTFFDTFNIFVEIRCGALGITSQNYNVSVTLTDANLLDAPSDYDYNYAASGFTDYDVVALLDQGNNNDDEYTVELVFSGDYSSNVVNGQTTSSVGLYEWTDSDKTLTLTAQNRDDMNSMLENVQIDFNQTQYDHTVTFVARNQTEVLVDFETQQITSSDDTILSEGVPKTYTTDFVLGAQAPDFNTGLSGSLFTATITPKDPATITNLQMSSSYQIPLFDSGNYTVYTQTTEDLGGSVDHKGISTDGTTALVVYTDSDDSNITKAKVVSYDKDTTTFTIEEDCDPTDFFSFEASSDFYLSTDGTTVVYDIVFGSTYYRITHKKSSGTWTKYYQLLDISGGYNRVTWLSNDGESIMRDLDPSLYQVWDSDTNTWIDSSSNTKFNALPSTIQSFFYLTPNADGLLVGDSGVTDSLKIYRWTGSSYNLLHLTAQPNGEAYPSSNTAPTFWISDDANWVTVYWNKSSQTDPLTMDIWALNWNGSSWDSYVVVEDLPYWSPTTPVTSVIPSLGKIKINNQGTVYALFETRDPPNNPVFDLREYKISNGSYYKTSASYTTTDYDRFISPTLYTPSANGDFMVRASGTTETESASGPWYVKVAWESEKENTSIEELGKQIDITMSTVSDMNNAISNVQVEVAGTNDITLIFEVTSADGDTQRAYTITYGS